MFDPTHIARKASENWPADIPQPEALANAIALFEESEWQMPPATGFDTTGATMKNLAARVEEHARALAVAEKWSVAHRAAREALSHIVIQLTAEAVPAVLDQLRPQFDQAASDYRAAVALLPERFDGDAIADAPTEIQSAHRAAATASRELLGIRTWLSSLADLPKVGGARSHHCLVLRPRDRNQLQTLLSQHRLSQAEQKLDPLLLVAARSGIEFAMSTPREAGDIESAINSTPVERKPLQFAKLTR
jgi:hypothetical protein